VKGLFLDEFLSFLEEKHSWRLAEDVSSAVGGAVFLWTSDYPSEMLERLIATSAALSGERREQLARQYGRHLFRLLERRFPELVLVPRDGFSFLVQLPARLALKLGVWLEDGRVPGVAVLREGDKALVRIALASASIKHVAEGFLKAMCEQFGDIVLARLDQDKEGGAVFTLLRQEGKAARAQRLVPLRAPVPL